MEVKTESKQSAVNVIPSGWIFSTVAALTTEFRGGAPFKPSDFKTHGIKVLPKGGVGRGGVLRIADKDIQYCSNDYASAHPRNQVDKTYTIVVLRDLVPSGPSIGLMVEICTDEKFVLAQGVYGFKVDSEKVDVRYLIQLSNTSWYRSLVNGIMVGSTQVHITNTAYKKAELPIPPLPEQRAIATALKDVDALLDSLDRLIAKKRNLKQAAMQQLLTGQTRLPGFSGEWKVKRLKSVAEISTGINKPLSEMGSGVLYVTVQDLYDKISIRTERLSRIKVTQTEVDARCLVVGDIVFGKSSVKRDGIGYPSQFLGCDEPVVFSGFTYCARAHHGIADPTFLFYALREENTRRWLIDNSQASALTNINQSIADAIPVQLPPTVSEQIAIASALMEMDTELVGLEQRRNKTAALKQGMMQELLTGRTRLV